MGQQGFRDLVPDAHDRVEGGHRFLENHGDARTTKLAQLIGRQFGEVRRDAVAVLESDFACDDGGWREQAHDGERRDGFSRAGLADQTEDFAGSDGERQAAHGGHGRSRLRGRKHLPSTGLRELDGQVADVEQRAHEEYGISAWTTFWDAIPVAPIRQGGSTPPTARSVLPSARAGPTPYRKLAPADSRTDRRSNRSSPYRPSA